MLKGKEGKWFQSAVLFPVSLHAVSMHAASQGSTPRKANNLSSVCPRHFSDQFFYTFCLQVVYLLSLQKQTKLLIFKILGFMDVMCGQGHVLVSWVEGHHTGIESSLTMKDSHTRMQRFGKCYKEVRQPVLGLSCIPQVPLCLCWIMWVGIGASVSFVLGETSLLKLLLWD